MRLKNVLRVGTLLIVILFIYLIHFNRGNFYIRVPRKVLAQSIQQACNAGSFPIAALTLRTVSGNIVQMGCADNTGDLYINGTVYVANNGNIQNSINMLPTTGPVLGGTLRIPCGTFVGPTIIFNGTAFIGDCANASIAMISAHIVFTYTTNLILNGTLNTRWDNITLDFSNCAAVGCGLQLIGGAQKNHFSYLSINQCGSTTVRCISLTNTVGLAVAFNTFDHTEVYGNTATTGVAGPALACIYVNGAGTPNTGPTITQNQFMDLFCRGALVGGIDNELNSDSNWYINSKFLQEGVGTPANSYILGFNLNTPATDQDADASFYFGVNWGGNFTSNIRTGQASGNLIFFEDGGGLPSQVVVGGTPSNIIHVVPLNGGIADLLLANGRLTVGVNGGSAPVTGSQVGDIAAFRTATVGVLQLGSDGGNFARLGATDYAVIGASGGGATIRTAAWTFATLPAASNGAIAWCSDCNATCAAGGGTGRNCSRENGVWVGF